MISAPNVSCHAHERRKLRNKSQQLWITHPRKRVLLLEFQVFRLHSLRQHHQFESPYHWTCHDDASLGRLLPEISMSLQRQTSFYGVTRSLHLEAQSSLQISE